MNKKKILDDPKLEKILSEVEIEMSLDTQEVLETEIWEVPRHYIWTSLFLQDPLNNYQNLRTYTKDMVKAHNFEMEFKKKYTDKVYHENTWRFLLLMNQAFIKIVEKLDK